MAQKYIFQIFFAFLVLEAHPQIIDPQNYFPIFEDPFDDNNKTWNLQYTNDQYSEIENGSLNFACGLENAACTQWLPKLSINTHLNFIISVETTWQEGINDAAYEIQWGANEDDSKSFSFGITANGFFQFSIFENERWSNTIPLTYHTAINKNGSNKIGIQKINQEIFLYVNDQKVGNTAFREFFGQKTSLVIWNQQVITFDNLKIGYLHHAKELVQLIVQEKMNQWQKRGEFEKSNDYYLRVQDENRKEKVLEIQAETLEDLQALKLKNSDYSDFVIDKYDADNETFLIKSKINGSYILSVPHGDASFVKANFPYFKLRFPKYSLSNTEFVLTSFEFIGGNNYIIRYSAADQLYYENSSINYQFDEIPLNLEVQPQQTQNVTDLNIKNHGISDVDINIPRNNTINENTFAVVIGNENYNKEIKVDFAINDARIVKQYLEKTMGIPSKNIQLVENATYGQILDVLKWLTDITKVYQGEANIIFYYAGHGVPDEQTKSAYLLPVDGNSQNTLSAIKLDEIYGQLSAHPTQSTVVFLDACFSGSARSDSQMLAKGRGVKIKPKSEALTGNLVVFSATTGDETALPYSEKQHGMFTYYLLKKMQETRGNIQMEELTNYVQKQVAQQSLVINKKPQNPQVQYSLEFSEDWKKVKLK
jgi:hypothetical protein